VREQIHEFLDALDRELLPLAKAGERLDLYHIGRSALVFHLGMPLPHGGTRDVDAVQLGHPLSPLNQKAVELFGKGTPNASRLGLYLEMVNAGLPPLPHGFRDRATEVPGDWRVIRLWRLDPHDLAVTKLKSFRLQDRQDLQFLCDADLLEAGKLRQALELAFIWDLEKDGDPHRERAFANLDRVIDYLEGRSRTL
jgi:hypothetical protein